MKSFSSVPWHQTRKRWVASIDLLGFSALVQNNHWMHVQTIYEDVRKRLVHGAHSENPVEYVWFSDTFVLYTKDDSKDGFRYIEARTRAFANGLILERIPFRGATACGNFFAHKQSNTFVGSALVEAYKQSETHNWIGHSLTESAVSRMGELGIKPENLFYRFWSIPLVTRFCKPGVRRVRLLAPMLGGTTDDLKQSVWYSRIAEMRATAGKKDKTKYTNTMRFMEKMSVTHHRHT